MKLVIPIILGLLGAVGGAGAGYFLRPSETDHPDAMVAVADQHDAEHASPVTDDTHEVATEYVKLNNQFVVPVIGKDGSNALVVLTLSLEVDATGKDTVFIQEPRLRDRLLQVMFDHANLGGFSGRYTDTEKMARLRRGLSEAAFAILGDHLKDVLITDIVRQAG